MTNAIPAAGMPAATTYPRSRAGGWAAPPDDRTLERERLETRARETDAAAQLLRLLPALAPRARAADRAGAWAAGRQRAGRPQRPGRVAQPRRARPGGAAPPRPRTARAPAG